MTKTIPTKCPECGGKIETEYSAPYQEYAGASVQGGYTYACCYTITCGWDDHFKGDLSDFSFRENTRGW